MKFIKYPDIPKPFKDTLNKEWIKKLKKDHKDMGFQEPEEWQISQHKERMIFNCIFYRTTQTPHIYFWSLINKIR